MYGFSSLVTMSHYDKQFYIFIFECISDFFPLEMFHSPVHRGQIECRNLEPAATLQSWEVNIKVQDDKGMCHLVSLLLNFQIFEDLLRSMTLVKKGTSEK